MHYWYLQGTKKPESGRRKNIRLSYAPIFGLSSSAILGIVCPNFYNLLGYNIS